MDGQLVRQMNGRIDGLMIFVLLQINNRSTYRNSTTLNVNKM